MRLSEDHRLQIIEWYSGDVPIECKRPIGRPVGFFYVLQTRFQCKRGFLAVCTE
jgi:hypothetical protein